MTLPLLISVPHAGLTIPPEVRNLCILTPDQIRTDGDEGAAEIYHLQKEVAEFITTDIARAVVDLNRTAEDRRPDGVVKTHTCWNEPVYHKPLPEELIPMLLDNYYYPYHRQLTQVTKQGHVPLGLDCHTMAAIGPPIGPDPGVERPWVCLSHADGTCPEDWLNTMADCFRETVGDHVSVNKPFRGGYIIRSHAKELPWMQVELSRDDFLTNREKHQRVLQAITRFCGSKF
jgi:N-formylglutamate amidohydrolase